MTIQERLRRSNFIMLIVPLSIAGLLLIAGFGTAAFLLETVYLPRIGLTLRDLHALGEAAEQMLKGMKVFIAVYAIVVAAALLAAVGFTNFYLTKNLFAQIETPLNTLVQGVQRIRDGDLDTPIGYTANDEFRSACDAVDEMAARLKSSLEQQQQQQQKKQELIADLSHSLKTPLTVIRAYTEALLENVAQNDDSRRSYLETIHTREADLEVLANELFEQAKSGGQGSE